jgi:hypothetical protein
VIEGEITIERDYDEGVPGGLFMFVCPKCGTRVETAMRTDDAIVTQVSVTCWESGWTVELDQRAWHDCRDLGGEAGDREPRQPLPATGEGPIWRIDPASTQAEVEAFLRQSSD